jgi:two-component sensor histidine kinase
LFIIAYNSFRIKNKSNQRIQTLNLESNHRISNNLQLLSSIFTLQLSDSKNDSVRKTLIENDTRLTCMQLIHNKLYQDNTTTRIEMQEYLTNLLFHIRDAFGDNDINLRIEVNKMMVEADKAISIGLIVNELTTNAIKYAFGENGGEIYLALKRDKQKLLLILSDNGKGLKGGTTIEAKSFGLKLVNILTRQLNATLVVNHDYGLKYIIEIVS